MSITQYEFDLDRYHGMSMLFPDEIEQDPWIMYHGTSGFNAGSIEREGFVWKNGNGSSEEIERLVNVFEEMKWGGLDGSSLAVLKPYSSTHGFEGTNASPVYFTETSKRALLFASRDHAGGEKYKAVRRSLDYLTQYLNSAEIQGEHYIQMKYEHEQAIGSGVLRDGLEPFRVDLDWLRNQIASFSELKDHADQLFERHEYGIVYAIKMNEKDLSNLELHDPMGIKCRVQVPPENIVCKMVIPGNYEHTEVGRYYEEIRKLRSFKTGIYKMLGRSR